MKRMSTNPPIAIPCTIVFPIVRTSGRVNTLGERIDLIAEDVMHFSPELTVPRSLYTNKTTVTILYHTFRKKVVND